MHAHQKTTNSRAAADADEAPSEPAVVPFPNNPNPAKAILAQSGISVWAIVGHWRGVGEDVALTAADYGISEAEVEAALAYYRDERYGWLIDAFLAMNDSYFE